MTEKGVPPQDTPSQLEQVEQALKAFNASLAENVNKTKTQYLQAIAALFPPKSNPSMFKKILNIMNIFESLRRSSTQETRHQLTHQFHREIVDARVTHQLEHGEEIAKLEAKKTDLKENEQFKLKQILKNDGPFIIKIPEGPTASSGNQQNLQTWLAIMASLNPHDPIYTNVKRLEDIKHYPRHYIQNLLQSHEQTFASLMTATATPIGDEKSLNQLFSQPGSFLISLTNPQQEKITLGVHHNQQGIWFYDSNRYAVCFPTDKLPTAEIVNKFATFLHSYQNVFYPHHTQGFAISTSAQELKKEKIANPLLEQSKQTYLPTSTKQQTSSELKTEKREDPNPDKPQEPQNQGPRKK